MCRTRWLVFVRTADTMAKPRSAPFDHSRCRRGLQTFAGPRATSRDAARGRPRRRRFGLRPMMQIRRTAAASGEEDRRTRASPPNGYQILFQPFYCASAPHDNPRRMTSTSRVIQRFRGRSFCFTVDLAYYSRRERDVVSATTGIATERVRTSQKNNPRKPNIVRGVLGALPERKSRSPRSSYKGLPDRRERNSRQNQRRSINMARPGDLCRRTEVGGRALDHARGARWISCAGGRRKFGEGRVAGIVYGQLHRGPTDDDQERSLWRGQLVGQEK